MKWTKKQVIGAVLGGLAIAALIWFCSVTLIESIRQVIEQVK